MSEDDTASGDGPAILRLAVTEIEREFAARPPTIGVIGLSGVGKSTTINAMFGTSRHTSASVRGTNRFKAADIEYVSDRVADARVKCAFKFYDAVGLGEDKDLDRNYLKRYREHLPKCDVAIWVLAARNRALALDQQYLAEIAKSLPGLAMVIAVNQVDLVDPVDWNERINMPSERQAKAIAEITADRQEKLSRFVKGDCPVVPYSAARYYNLQTLFATCLKAAPPHRRWMFELIKSFSTHDWLSRAKGLTDAQRAALAARHIKSDAKLKLADKGD